MTRNESALRPLRIASLFASVLARASARTRALAPAFFLALGVLGLALAGCGEATAPAARGGPIAMRRLTAEQYRQAIEDTFSADIEIVGRFEPENRRDGLVAIGSAWVTVTPSGFEQYEAMARHIARQVVSETGRDRFVPCRPKSATAPDPECTEALLRAIGPALLRRPLEPADIAPRVAAADAAASAREDFYAGLELVVTSLLVAPDFLFRIEEAVPDPSTSDRLLLTDTTLASRLSYLIWNAAPDARLLEAAARGELSTPSGLSREVDRLLSSPKLAQGVRALFEDVLQFDAFEDLGKDPIRYPKYSGDLARDAREQTLRVIVDHLLTRRGDYRDLFTTRQSFMTRRLGSVYQVPVASEQGWESFTFAAGDPRAGLLAQASLNMLNAHPGRSSATLRGVFLREALLCQEVPPAPADVDFGLFNEDDSPEYRTARERLAVHSTAASCRNCHKLTDPIGLGLEVFDGIGSYRTTENGAPIDTSGEMDGEAFADSRGLGEVFRASPLVGACLVENVYRYAVGREPANSERRLMRYLERRLESSGYRLDALLREVALSEGFRTATDPRDETSDGPSPILGRAALGTAESETS